MKAILFSIVLAAGVIFPSAAVAQLTVVVEATAQDTVGSRMAFALRERLRQSSAFKFVTTSEEALFKLGFVTIDASANTSNAGYSTVYSAVFAAWQPQTGTWTFLSNFVGTCGSSRVNECADTLVAEADKTADGPRNFYKTYYKK
jgi:hypothetical protein